MPRGPRNCNFTNRPVVLRRQDSRNLFAQERRNLRVRESSQHQTDFQNVFPQIERLDTEAGFIDLGTLRGLITSVVGFSLLSEVFYHLPESGLAWRVQENLENLTPFGQFVFNHLIPLGIGAAAGGLAAPLVSKVVGPHPIKETDESSVVSGEIGSSRQRRLTPITPQAERPRIELEAPASLPRHSARVDREATPHGETMSLESAQGTRDLGPRRISSLNIPPSSNGRQRIGGYILGEQIGGGGFGKIYKAHREKGLAGVDRDYAVKVLKAGKTEHMERFRQEIEVLVRFTHSNIVSFIEAGEEKGKYYLVMEHVKGNDLATILFSFKFLMRDFKENLTISRLCQVIRDDVFPIRLFSADGTIERVNEILEIPNFYDVWLKKGKKIDFSRTIKSLISETSAYRSKLFSDLEGTEKNTIIRFNRLLLEAIYFQACPKKEQRQLSIEETLEIALGVAKGLEHAYLTGKEQTGGKGIIHRDINPNNIMIKDELHDPGRVKVIDFGLVKEERDQGQTASGLFMGTPRYASPEKVRGEKNKEDHRSDMYHLGLVLCAMLTNLPPFWRMSDTLELLEAQKTKHPEGMESYESFRRFNSAVSESLWKIMERLLRKNQDERYDSYEELIRALENELYKVKRGNR